MVIGLFVLLPPVILVLLLARYSVNVPFWDSWELVPIFEKINNGTVTFGDFFAQHNEHRILFPRLIMVGLANISHWNALYEIATNVVLAAVSFWFLYLIFKRTFTNQTRLIVGILLVSIIFFSPIQFENWMWGWQIQWFLNVLGLIVAVWSLSVSKLPPIARLIIGAIAATIATYSLASGFFVWLVCAPLLFFSPQLKKLLPVWIALAIIVVGSHYIGYHDPEYHPSKFLFLHDPLGLLKYFLIYIARPIVVDFLESIPTAVLYIGAIAGAVGFFARKNLKKEAVILLPWVAIGMYGIFAGLSTAVSRLGLGLEQAYSNRYITLSSLLLIALVVGLLKVHELMRPGNKALTYLPIAALSFILILTCLNFSKGIIQMKERHTYLLTAKQCAQDARSATDDCLLKLYPDKDRVWQRLQFVRQEHLSDL